MLNQVRYYPLVQLLIVGLFITITLIALTTSFRSTQNQVWAGMAKETAHQLGTPIKLIAGMGRNAERCKRRSEMIVSEMEKDVNRLKLVSDRFGKIGSTPQLEQNDVVEQVNNDGGLHQEKSAGKNSFYHWTYAGAENYRANIPPLFDWVIENLLKNALDAMEGKGSINSF